MFFKHGVKNESFAVKIMQIQKALAKVKLSPTDVATNNARITEIKNEINKLNNIKYRLEQKKLDAERPLKAYQKQLLTIQELIQKYKERITISHEMYSEKLAEIQALENQINIILQKQQNLNTIHTDFDINELKKLISEHHLEEDKEAAEQLALKKLIYEFHYSESLEDLEAIKQDMDYLNTKKSVDNNIKNFENKIKDVENNIKALEMEIEHLSVDFTQRGILVENVIYQSLYNLKIKGFDKLDQKLVTLYMQNQIKDQIKDINIDFKNKAIKSTKVILDTIDRYSLERVIDAGIMYIINALFDPQNAGGREFAIEQCLSCRWIKNPETNEITPPVWCNFTLEEFQQLVYDTCCQVLVNGLDKKAAQIISITTNKPAQLVNNGYGELLAKELNIIALYKSASQEERDLDPHQSDTLGPKSFKR